MPPTLPEQYARKEIDAQLAACGGTAQDYKAVDFGAGRGVALREVPLTTGPCNYLLLVDRRAVGVIEAKKQGTTLSAVADQSARYASSLPDFLAPVAPPDPRCGERHGSGSTASLAMARDHGAPHPRFPQENRVQPSRNATAGDGMSPATLPFLYESTGVETLFRDTRDPDARSRRVFSLHRPETLDKPNASLVA